MLYFGKKKCTTSTECKIYLDGRVCGLVQVIVWLEQLVGMGWVETWVCVILEMNGCLPCVVGKECSSTIKMWQTPFRNYSNIWKMPFPKMFTKPKPCMCQNIALCKSTKALSLIYPYACVVIPFRRVRFDLLSTLYSPLLCWTEEDPDFNPKAAFE